MKTAQIRWTSETGWQPVDAALAAAASLVLVFADTPTFQEPACYETLRAMFPNALIAGCSSAGSVLDVEISDGDMVATIVQLERGRVALVGEDVPEGTAAVVGQALMDRLAAPDLVHVVVLSDGLTLNGSQLAGGLNAAGGGRVAVTGGLAGDGTRFGTTWVMDNGPARRGHVALIGLYGPLQVRSGCFAGWQEFGGERRVTRSNGNVVFEIDGEPALALYKRYLGDQAAALPSSGLRFPLSVRATNDDEPLIRTLLAVDEDAQSLVFAGDVHEGHLCRLMKTNLRSLIDNAGLAARHAKVAGGSGLALVVSCVGRRLVLGQLTEEELEAVRDTLGESVAITGFYSYGELAPFSDRVQCELHNQTMTLTTIYD